VLFEFSDQDFIGLGHHTSGHLVSNDPAGIAAACNLWLLIRFLGIPSAAIFNSKVLLKFSRLRADGQVGRRSKPSLELSTPSAVQNVFGARFK
jgi:hypothetical protein